MRNAGLEEAQAGIKIAGRNINTLRYADDTTLMASLVAASWSARNEKHSLLLQTTSVIYFFLPLPLFSYLNSILPSLDTINYWFHWLCLYTRKEHATNELFIIELFIDTLIHILYLFQFLEFYYKYK